VPFDTTVVFGKVYSAVGLPGNVAGLVNQVVISDKVDVKVSCWYTVYDPEEYTNTDQFVPAKFMGPTTVPNAKVIESAQLIPSVEYLIDIFEVLDPTASHAGDTDPP
jgi:hypothetical protein